MSEKMVRLTVNLNLETAAALREIATQRGETLTETIRRCIAVYKFISDEMSDGRVVRTLDRDGRNARDVLFL